jgi:hypothetical protein
LVKAGKETITRILLREAKALALEIYQSERLAEQRVAGFLFAGKIRVRYLDIEGPKRKSDPDPSNPAFWQIELVSETGPHQVIRILQINWNESCAHRKITALCGYSAYRIEIVREDLLKLLPLSEATVPSKRGAPLRPDTVKVVGDALSQINVPATVPRGFWIATARALHPQIEAKLRRTISVGHISDLIRNLRKTSK